MALTVTETQERTKHSRRDASSHSRVGQVRIAWQRRGLLDAQDRAHSPAVVVVAIVLCPGLPSPELPQGSER